MIDAAVTKGRPIPSWAQDEPELYPGDDFFLTAFYDLSTCRQYSDAVPGCIPWTAIVEYADRSGLEPEVSAGFVRVIRTMDTTFLKWHSQRQKLEVDKQRRRTAMKGTHNGRF